MLAALFGGNKTLKNVSTDRLELPHLRKDWDAIKRAMGEPKYGSVRDVIARIHNACPGVHREGFELKGLEALLNSFPDDHKDHLLTKVIPYIHSLVLALPRLFPDDSLLKVQKQGQNVSTTFTSEQVAGIMAAAFFALLPARPDVWAPNPPIDSTASDDEDDYYPARDEDPVLATLPLNEQMQVRRKARMAGIRRQQKEYDAYVKAGQRHILQDMNFDRMYCTQRKPFKDCVNAKLECVFAYFDTKRAAGVGLAQGALAANPASSSDGAGDTPESKVAPAPSLGNVTVTRRVLSADDIKILASDALAKNTTPLVEMVVRTSGTFEDDAPAMLQTDFANKFIGSSVLETGCVQEQIRFSINTECFVSIGISEMMREDEAIIIQGTQRIANYKGYDKGFRFNGYADDKTPLDSKNRRLTTIIGIDAIKFDKHATELQFSEKGMLRDIAKAYLGYNISDDELGYKCQGVATGNWGCGAFHGAVDLKSMLLWIAVSLTGRPVHYFPYGDKRAAPLASIVDLVRKYKQQQQQQQASADGAAESKDGAGTTAASGPWSTTVTVGDLWKWLLEFVRGNEAAYSATYYPVKARKNPAKKVDAPQTPDLYGYLAKKLTENV